MELHSRNRNVALYLVIMIAGTIICNIVSACLWAAAFSGWDVEWGLVILAWLINLIPQIYHICAVYLAVDDYNRICDRNNEDYLLSSSNYLIVLLLSRVTLGIYGFYWFYKYGNNLKELGRRRGITIREKGSTYLCMVLIPNIITWILTIITIIFSITMVDAARTLSFRTVESSGTGAIICGCLLMFASVCSWIMECIAWAKWMTNLNRITRTDTVGAGQITPGHGGSGQIYGGTGRIPQAPATGGIRVLTGQYMDMVIPMGEGEEIILGRDGKKSHLVFRNEHVSRVHCGVRYMREANYYLVTDYSTNGTCIKGGAQLLKNSPTVCSAGTVLVLGESGEECMLL